MTKVSDLSKVSLYYSEKGKVESSDPLYSIFYDFRLFAMSMSPTFSSKNANTKGVQNV